MTVTDYSGRELRPTEEILRVLEVNEAIMQRDQDERRRVAAEKDRKFRGQR